MIELWVALVFAASPVEPAPGCLLFLEHANKAVERFTDGEIGHVAIVFEEKGRRSSTRRRRLACGRSAGTAISSNWPG